MVTARFDNPFHDLWVKEILDPDAFVRTFSDKLVSDAESLFSTGNIVLRGRQGSGKSMLLALLETKIRAAYHRTGVNYPVPAPQRQFISAGVQLTQQNASLVAARAAEAPLELRAQVVAATFADYLNSLLSRDLLRNVAHVAEERRTGGGGCLEELPVDLSSKAQTKFLASLRASQFWPAMLGHEITTIEDVSRSLDERLRAHRQYANTNIDQLPTNLIETRAPAGAPVAELATALRESGVLGPNTLVFLRIDQHEELYELERTTGLGAVFRRVLNSALARRDPRIAYRIGTRHYAWEADLTCWGSGAPLEEERDYSVVDLDAILRRGENSKGWKFPALARDVVTRRLEFAQFPVGGDPLSRLFGKSMNAQEKAKAYAGSAADVLRIEPEWATAWKEHLRTLWKEGKPLDAKFGEAWLRQKRQQDQGLANDPDAAEGVPWRSSEWWAKERNEIALLQIAGDRQQALIWSGERQVIELAGNNVLALMTIVKTVWATWQRRNPDAANHSGLLPSFSQNDQLIGISEASRTWMNKIRVGFEAERRADLVTALGSWFRRRMLADRSLTYPGHNGFSLRVSDMKTGHPLVALIKVCRDHGDLLETSHTTKEKDQAFRLKWYLHPLLCPLFRIPYVRTKEPIYTSLVELTDLLERQADTTNESVKASDPQLQLPGL